MKPVPILQTVNLVLALLTFAYEWPLKYVAGSRLHSSIEARLAWLPLVCLSSVLLYQATNAAVYYFIAGVVYFVAYADGEVSWIPAWRVECHVLMSAQVICAVPWTLPKRTDRRPRPEKV